MTHGTSGQTALTAHRAESGALASRVEFFRHSLGDEEKAAAQRVLDGLFLTMGEEVYAFERELAAYLGLAEVVAVSSCTGAEHLSLITLGIGPGDEVITTPLTFIATATAILHAGATPVFVDVDPDTGCIDPALIETAITSRTRAIVPVHLYGTMCDMHAIRALADRHALAIVEDAAHCVEGRRGGLAPGQAGDMACFSFYATKTITSGEGGAVATNDPVLAERLRRLRMHGMSEDAAERYAGSYRHWDMVELGWKANLSNIQAAILRPQIPRLDPRRDRREAIARAYDEVVDSVSGFDRPKIPTDARSSYHLYTVWAPSGRRDQALEELERRGIGCAVNYRAVHQLTWFREHVEVRSSLSHAEEIGDRTISIPMYDGLSDHEVERVCEALTDVGSL